MQQLNMFMRFGKVYWDYAGLMVDSGLLGEKEKNNNYDKISKAIGNIENVVPPSINRSKLGFTIEGENILFGFKAIAGLDKETYPKIEANRPFKSFGDFLERMYKTDILSEGKIAIMIKAGCFDEFNSDRRTVAIKFIEYAYPRKAPTMTQLPMLKKYTGNYKNILDLVEFRKLIVGKNKVPMNNDIEQMFLEKYVEHVKYDFTDGKLEINIDSFETYYKNTIKPLQEHLKTDYVIDEYTRAKRNGAWFNLFRGNISSWEFSTLYTYFKPHELSLMPMDNYFELTDFYSLPDVSEPITYNTWLKKTKKDGQIIKEEVQTPVYKTYTIAGTVISKDNTKGYVNLLTENGVVSVKLQQGKYAYYNSKYEGDDSWFNRGTILVVRGYRRYTDFIARVWQRGAHTITKVESYNKERIMFRVNKNDKGEN